MRREQKALKLLRSFTRPATRKAVLAEALTALEKALSNRQTEHLCVEKAHRLKG